MLQTHLFRRGARYYLRRRLPLTLARATGRTHIVKALVTTDPQTACRRVRHAGALLDRWFARMMTNGQVPTADQLNRVLDRLFEILLYRDEAERALRPVVDENVAEFELYEVIWENDGTEDPDLPNEVTERKSLRLAAHEIDVWNDRLVRNDARALANDIEAVLAEEGLKLDPASPEYKILLRKSLKTALRAARIALGREEGMTDEEALASLKSPAERFNSLASATAVVAPATSQAMPEPAEAPATTPRTSVPAPMAPLLSVAFEKMRKVKMGTDWRSDTGSDSAIGLRLWLDLMGDRPLDKITSDDAFEFRLQLGRMPSMNGKGLYQGLTPSQAIALADTIDAGTYVKKDEKEPDPKRPVPRYSLKNQNKYLTYFTTLYNHPPVKALGFGHPFARTLHLQKRLLEENSRDGWDPEDMARLFQSPVWTGCFSEARRARPGSNIYQDALYWVPLLAAYGAFRLEEMAGLQPRDIEEMNGIWFIRIRPNDIRPYLKNPAATRNVPVHPVLEKLGFVEFARQGQAEGRQQLFAELNRGGPEQKWGYQLTKKFTNYRQNIKVYKFGIDFHSFRHNFTNALQNTEFVKDSVIDYLTGHKPEGMTDKEYHKRGSEHRFAPEILRATVERLSYRCLEFLEK